MIVSCTYQGDIWAADLALAFLAFDLEDDDCPVGLLASEALVTELGEERAPLSLPAPPPPPAPLADPATVNPAAAAAAALCDEVGLKYGAPWAPKWWLPAADRPAAWLVWKQILVHNQRLIYHNICHYDVSQLICYWRILPN